MKEVRSRAIEFGKNVNGDIVQGSRSGDASRAGLLDHSASNLT